MVTGASGFTGKVMVAHLLKANLYDKIHAIDIVKPTYEQPTVVNHQADIAGRRRRRRSRQAATSPTRR